MGLIAAIAVFAILAWPFAVALLVVLVVVALTEKLSA
jgi:hypothetical protein